MSPSSLMATKLRQYSQSSNPSFTYRLGASSSGKASRLKAPDHNLNYFNNSLIEGEPSYFTSKPRYSGEDAFFMAHVAKSNRYVVFGVADGVGGWQDQGIDPGDFSHGLCKYMAGQTYRPRSESDLKPKNLLQFGYDEVLKDRKILAGGSTACLAAIEPNGNIEAANLGDSGFLILQPGKVAFKSPAQTHAFNTPYQLSKLTRRMQAQNAIFGKSAQISESPQQSDVTNHVAKHGDVLVFATDGVWDNLSAMDTLSIITPLMEKNGYWSGSGGATTTSQSSDSPSSEVVVNGNNLRPAPEDTEAIQKVANLPAELAYAVMRAAKLASLDTRRDGPFAKEVQRYYPGENWHGGKVDDISVIVCLCVQDGPTTEWKPKAKL
ncbi:hypothetical protein MBLNU459_g3073t1 [Dothideomycetes sp. NU459]